MRILIAVLLVFLGGFAVMVLEMIGARYLAKDFGGSFYVWTSQIGVILIALSLGYVVGGTLADRYNRATPLFWWLALAGLITFFIPSFADPLISWIVMRHPAEQSIPLVWQKLDPAIGSALIFLFPCFVLATLSPYMIRILSQHVSRVGRISGLVYAASTVGSIAGVFISGYYLIDHFGLSAIFRGTGLLIFALALLCPLLDNFKQAKGEPDAIVKSEISDS